MFKLYFPECVNCIWGHLGCNSRYMNFSYRQKMSWALFWQGWEVSIPFKCLMNELSGIRKHKNTNIQKKTKKQAGRWAFHHFSMCIVHLFKEGTIVLSLILTIWLCNMKFITNPVYEILLIQRRYSGPVWNITNPGEIFWPCMKYC